MNFSFMVFECNDYFVIVEIIVSLDWCHFGILLSFGFFFFAIGYFLSGFIFAWFVLIGYGFFVFFFVESVCSAIFFCDCY